MKLSFTNGKNTGVKEIIKRCLKENRRKIERMEKLQRKMEKNLREWKKMKDETPIGDSIRHLIESLEEADKAAGS